MNTIEFHTPEYYMALQQAQKHHPADSPILKDMATFLDCVDEAVLRGYRIHESQVYPKVRFSTVSVSAVGVAKNYFQTDIQPETGGSNSRVEVYFFPSVPPPVGDAGSLGYVFGAVNKELPRAINRSGAWTSLKDNRIYLLGLPTALSGNITKDFVTQTTVNGFQAYGQLYAEAIRTLLATDQIPNPSHIILHGASMGAVMAAQTAAQLSEFQDRMTLRLENPTGDHKPSLLWWRGITMVLGFLGELAIRQMFDKDDQELNKLNSKYLVNISQELPNGESVSPATSWEKTLKLIAYAQQIILLMKGTPLELKGHRHIVEGVWDPADIKLSKIYNRFIGPSRIEQLMGMPSSVNSRLLNAFHWLNFDRTPWWERRIARDQQPESTTDS